MMEIFRASKPIGFMRGSRLYLLLSASLVALALLLVFFRGFALSVDFTGGTIVELETQKALPLDAARHALEKEGLGRAMAQRYGGERSILVRLPASAPGEAKERTVLSALQALDPQTRLARVEYVGPQVGKELAQGGAYAALAASLGILLYVALRFDWRLALAALCATFHDILLVLACFSLFRLEFSLTVLAAVLAVMGYSLNDTVVIFDRIRENLGRMRRQDTAAVIDSALTETLSRTLMVSLATLMVVLSLLAAGGEVLRGFSLAITLGIVIGTYSSIFVASPIALVLGIKPPAPAKKADHGAVI